MRTSLVVVIASGLSLLLGVNRLAAQNLAADNKQPPQGDAEPVPRERPVPPIGLAAQYPGDQGIAGDPRVIFAENFEQPSLNDLKTHWESVTNAEIMSLSDDVPARSGGNHLQNRLQSETKLAKVVFQPTTPQAASPTVRTSAGSKVPITVGHYRGY